MATRDKKLTDALVEAALRKHAGLAAYAARELGVTRQVIHHRVAQSEHLRTVAFEAREEVLDEAEGTIVTAIKAGDIKSAQWFLDRVGHRRGYQTKPDGGVDEDQLEAFCQSLGGDVVKLRAALDAIRDARARAVWGSR